MPEVELGVREQREAEMARDELAPVHSITSSARASSVGGTVRPSALAVTRLMAKSNNAGYMTRQIRRALPTSYNRNQKSDVRGPLAP